MGGVIISVPKDSVENNVTVFLYFLYQPLICFVLLLMYCYK